MVYVLSLPHNFMALSREDTQKLMRLPIEELAASLGDGEPGSPKTFVVKALIEYKLQKDLLNSSRLTAWAAISAACISAMIGAASLAFA
jgi:hypothetical protein